MKIIILLCVLFLGYYSLIAQEYKKAWSDGPLSWQDFTEIKNPLYPSEFKYFLGYQADRQRYGDSIVVRWIAEGYMDTKLSWIDPDHKTDQLLRYYQVNLDLLERYRRKLQEELDRTQSVGEAGGKLSFVYGLCNAEIARFQTESAGGQDVKMIEFWEQKLSGELTPKSGWKIPEIENRNFGYGLHAGFGAGFFTGSLGDHFAPSFNFIFGFDFAYKYLLLYLNGTLAGADVTMNYVSHKKWYEDQRANVAIIDASLGVAVIDGARFKLSPFGGLGITEFTNSNNDDSNNNQRMVDYNLLFGINADYKTRTKIRLISSSTLGVKDKVETSVRARLYIARAAFYDDLQGYSINLTIGICGFDRLIRLK